MGIYKPIFIDDYIAISGMPASWNLEDVVEKFDAVLSLATPVEHQWNGYDPRLLTEHRIDFLWLTTAKYNALALLQLLRGLEWLRNNVNNSRYTLVHSYNGCGRAASLGAAWLSYYKGIGITEAIARVSRALGCSLESLHQKSIVVSASMIKRIPSHESMVSEILRARHEISELIEASMDYVLLLGYAMLPYNNNLIQLMSNSLKVLASKRGGELPSLAIASILLAKTLDYAIVDINIRIKKSEAWIYVKAWIPRKMHPAYARPLRKPSKEAIETVARIISKLLDTSKHYYELMIIPPDVIPAP